MTRSGDAPIWGNGKFEPRTSEGSSARRHENVKARVELASLPSPLLAKKQRRHFLEPLPLFCQRLELGNVNLIDGRLPFPRLLQLIFVHLADIGDAMALQPAIGQIHL